MRNTQRAYPSAANLAAFIIYVAAVLTVVMALFPPFTSLNGTEHAFVLTGPEWSRSMGVLGEELGLRARIHWIALAVQLAALWAIALGARWFLGEDRGGARGSAMLLVVLAAAAGETATCRGNSDATPEVEAKVSPYVNTCAAVQQSLLIWSRVTDGVAGSAPPEPLSSSSTHPVYVSSHEVLP